MAVEVRGLAPLLQVYDMPTSVLFYRDKLGFEVVATSPTMGEDYFHWCLLRLGDAEVMLNTAYEFNDQRPPRPRDPVQVQTYPAVGLYFGCPDVDAAYEQFQAKGVTVDKPKVAPYGMKQMNLRDPDGYFLCFQWQA
jgi:glyoxylase I family protein